MARWWLWDEYPYRLVEPTVDLWIGGPNADGRGLDAVNGGYSPAPGLQITSPTADPGPSGQARYFVRTHHQTWSASTPLWAPKQAGVLANIGRRAWTGSGWSYVGATDAVFRGPCPALSTHGLTDTVRVYAPAGPITVSDVSGGVVQPYGQRVYAPAGTAEGGWASYYGNVSAINPGDTVYWHVIMEVITALDTHRAMFGIYDGTTYVGHPTNAVHATPTLNYTGSYEDGPFYVKIAHRGTGPNNGTLVEIYCQFTVATAASGFLRLVMYPLYIVGLTTPHEIVVHHAAGHYVPNAVLVPREWPSVLLCAAGAVPSLLAERVAIADVSNPCTVLMRIDWRQKPDPFPYYSDVLVAWNGWDAAWHTSYNNLRWYPPDITRTGVLSRSVMTFGLVVDSQRYVGMSVNGVVVQPRTVAASNPLVSSLDIGRVGTNYGAYPIRRVMFWPRVLSAADLAAWHDRIVAAEGGA